MYELKIRKRNPPVLSQLVALIPFLQFVQVLAIFSEGDFLNTVSKIQEKKKEVALLCSRPPKNVINKALSRRSRATTADWNVQKSVMNEQSWCIANTEHIDRNPSRFFAIYLFVRPFTLLMQLNNNHNIFKPAEIIYISLEQTADMPCRKRLTLNTQHIYS